MYYISCLIQNDDGRVWRCSGYDGCVTIQRAKEMIEKYRRNFTVLSAWITEEDVLVFHECYVDVLGRIEGVK